MQLICHAGPRYFLARVIIIIIPGKKERLSRHYFFTLAFSTVELVFPAKLLLHVGEYNGA